MNTPHLNNEILSIVQKMAMAKMEGSIFLPTLELKFQEKLNELSIEIQSKGARNFWAILNRLIAHEKITHGVEYRVNETQPTFELLLMDVYNKYVESMKEFMPKEPLLELGTLYNILSREGNFIKRHKPFFGGCQRWALQFYSDPDFIMLKNS